MQFTIFAPLANMDNYDANVQIYDTAKSNANLELQIYHIFAPFANISKSVFSSSDRCEFEGKN